MATIRIITTIAAPPSVCFDLARDVDFHVQTLAGTGERAVAGRTTGLIGMGEVVTWRAKHFGVTQEFTAQITVFNPPFHFQDVASRSAFKRFIHDHHFRATESGTEMEDVVDFQSPFGWVGLLFDRLYLTRYIRRLLDSRCRQIQAEAERRSRKGSDCTSRHCIGGQ
jgi:ligand-binding SRPBCC domain-containing protein